ncbi:hypothetical protein like AT3G23880 [Hibiscus trionum]|uniref:F-box domain-containing protein n=1 Tax=Hibiscus trionum TaxID=183268 RepID=A0A9W7HKK3_HIBTR|nr:hypothetical protein like AT3G23880 [Hibiscus trionum]
MNDYMPVEVIAEILKRLPVKSVGKCRSVCKTWNTLISHSSFISTHLQASLSNNTPLLLLKSWGNSQDYVLHYDNDRLDRFKQLQFPPVGVVPDSIVIGSCNGLICFHFWPGNKSSFILWNPSIQKYVILSRPSISNDVVFSIGFGFDSRTSDYKLLMVGVGKDDSWVEPYLFSLNENCWKRVAAIPPNYTFHGGSVPSVNGALHWIGHQERNNGRFSNTILWFDFSAEEFFELGLPESLIGVHPMYLSTMKYGESSIAVRKRDPANHELLNLDLDELWVMKEYGVVESWTKVLKLTSNIDRKLFPNAFVGGIVTRTLILLKDSYVESLALLDKTVGVHTV